MPDLLSLPDELFCKISGFIHPQTVIDWACTCRVLSRCSLQALQTHRKYQSELRVVHDRNPMTIPLLSRSSLSQPEILWYLRSLDIWELREKFQEWKSPTFSHGNPHFDRGSLEFLNWPEKHYDCSHIDATLYTDEELKRYRSILSDLLCIKDPLVDKWMQRLQSGSDEILKVLLMALSPRLNKVTFVQDENWGSVHQFRLLASTLRALAPLPCLQWPCFQNIKTVFVGQITELRHPSDAYYQHYRVLATLFLLPAIEDLYFRCLMREENDPDSDLDGEEEEDAENPAPYVWEWEVGRSSCQNLTFDDCELASKTIASFIGATHSLRSINGVSNDGIIVSALLEHSKHSLETVKFDGRLTTFDGRFTTSDVLSQPSLQPFEKLTHIMLSASQLIDMSNYKPLQIEYTAEYDVDAEKTDFGIVTWIELSAFLPPTLQKLKIDGWLNNIIIFEHQFGGLIDHLVSLVNAKLSSPNGDFAFLTGLCIEDMRAYSKLRWRSNEPNWLHPSWLGDLKRVCQEAKVNIHIPGGGMLPEESFGELERCSLCEQVDVSIDSAPAIPERQDEGK